MAYPLDEIDLSRFMDDLKKNYWDSTCTYAEKVWTRGNPTEAEELTMKAFEETWRCLRNNPATIIQKPQWWLETAVKHEAQNRQRSKLRRSTTSLEQLQKGRQCNEAETEEYMFELAAPMEQQPDYILEAEEEERERRERKKKVILAANLDEETTCFALLHIVDGWSDLEIANRYGKTSQQVKRTIWKCIREMERMHNLQIVAQEEGKK